MEPSQLENRQAYLALKSAYISGILKAPATARVEMYPPVPYVPESFRQALNNEPYIPVRRDCVWDQIDDPARDTRRIEYQDSSRWYSFEEPDPPFLLNRAYELARFVAAPDEAGFVRRCSTYCGINDAGNIKELSTTDPQVLRHNGIIGYWFLRLYQGTFGDLPAWDYALPLAAVGGYPFHEINYWRDYRFQWGGSSQNKVCWLVPSNHMLRLYFLATVNSLSNLRELQGRLVGYTQPVRVMPSAKNAIYAW